MARFWIGNRGRTVISFIMHLSFAGREMRSTFFLYYVFCIAANFVLSDALVLVLVLTSSGF